MVDSTQPKPSHNLGFILNTLFFFRLMGLEPVVGFINFNYWQRENLSGVLELLFCFIVNNFVMFCVMIFPVLLLDEHPWHALDVFCESFVCVWI